MKRVYIAEKRSLGLAIAAALPKPHTKVDGVKNAVQAANGEVVAWLAGHILYQAPPEAYDERFKKWDVNALPIIPDDWKMLIRPDAKELFNGIKKLLKEASEVVNAGDPGREGQLLVDEVIEHCRYKGPVKRILINDVNLEAVERALVAIQPNENFRRLMNSALARARGDWVHGLNMTRLYTKMAQKGGFQGVVKIGRVKTPVTALVVRRDQAIASFTPKPFYQPRADISLPEGHIRANWIPGDAQEGLDEEGRLCDAAIASEIKSRLDGKPAEVTKSEKKRLKTPPPLGYNLTKLQIDCSLQFGFAAHETLEICQGLYEAGITTYPRSSCQYLPDGHHAQAPETLENIAKFAHGLAGIAEGTDPSRKGKVFDDSKIGEHHAIVPTPKSEKTGELTEREEKVYGLIARRYIAFFYPDYEYEQTTVEVRVESELFRCQGRTPLKEGWKVVSGDLDEESGGCEKSNDKESENESENPKIPPVETGDKGVCDEIVIKQKMTIPPARFTEATLLAAMESVSKFVKDPQVKKILKETEGLGTEATRAAILKELFDSGQLAKDGKKVLSTAMARKLIGALPEEITLPDMTASWELAFREIVEGGKSLDETAKFINERVREFVDSAKGKELLKIEPDADVPPVANAKKKNMASSKTANKSSGIKCDKCGKPMIRRSGTSASGKKYDFYGCSGFPNCKETINVT